jgi:hypothetical protein
VELLLAFGLSDAAVIAWSAGLMTGEQLLAWAFTYLLIAFGVLFTSYEMGHSQPAELVRLPPKRYGAGDGNRTRMGSLEGYSPTFRPHPLTKANLPQANRSYPPQTTGPNRFPDRSDRLRRPPARHPIHRDSRHPVSTIRPTCATALSPSPPVR